MDYDIDFVNKSYDFEQKITRAYDLIYERHQKLLDRKTSDLKLYTEGIVNASNSFTRIRRGSLHALMNRLVSSVSILINEEKNSLSLINQEQLQQSKKAIDNQEDVLKKQLEMLSLLVEHVINNKRTYLTNALIIISSSSPKAIIKKGFTIPRVNGNPYKGEQLIKGTIIKLEFKDSVIVTKYVKQEK